MLKLGRNEKGILVFLILLIAIGGLYMLHRSFASIHLLQIIPAEEMEACPLVCFQAEEVEKVDVDVLFISDPMFYTFQEEDRVQEILSELSGCSILGKNLFRSADRKADDLCDLQYRFYLSDGRLVEYSILIDRHNWENAQKNSLSLLRTVNGETGDYPYNEPLLWKGPIGMWWAQENL